MTLPKLGWLMILVTTLIFICMTWYRVFTEFQWWMPVLIIIGIALPLYRLYPPVK